MFKSTQTKGNKSKKKTTSKIAILLAFCTMLSCSAFATPSLAVSDVAATECSIQVGDIIQYQIFLPAELNPDGVDGYIADDETYSIYMEILGYTPGTEIIVGVIKYVVMDNYYLEAIEIVPLNISSRVNTDNLSRGTSIPSTPGSGTETGSFSINNYIYGKNMHYPQRSWHFVSISPTTSFTCSVSVMDSRNNESMQTNVFNLVSGVPSGAFMAVILNNNFYLKFSNSSNVTGSASYSMAPDY